MTEQIKENIPAILGFIIPVIWLAQWSLYDYGIDMIEILSRQAKKRRIIFPILATATCPFLFTHIFKLLSATNFSTIPASAYSAFVTIIIGCITAYIAYQQYITNKKKLRFDFFNSRYQIFLGLCNLIIDFQKNYVVDKNLYKIFELNLLPSQFFFEEDLVEYLQEINTKLTRIQEIELLEFNEPFLNENQKQKNIRERQELARWVNSQTAVVIKKFYKYFRFNA